MYNNPYIKNAIADIARSTTKSSSPGIVAASPNTMAPGIARRISTNQCKRPIHHNEGPGITCRTTKSSSPASSQHHQPQRQPAKAVRSTARGARLTKLMNNNKSETLETAENKRAIFLEGVRVGFPIGLGYFAVAFSLGIAARDYGFSAFQGFIASLFTYASAGQYIGFSLYAANATLLQLIILTIITNLRYILMGFALNQRMPEGTPLGTRMLVGSCITDEIFGATIARPGIPTPYYTFGALLTAAPMWAAGTAIGISAGSILPQNIVSALSVALFGMFIASIIPPARNDRATGIAVLASFACSYAASRAPVIRDLSEGTRMMLLAILISAAFALIFPRKDEETADQAGQEDNTERKPDK